MYVRFVLDEPRTHPARGLFRIAYDLAWDPALPEWLRHKLSRAVYWFDTYLAVPTRLHVISRGKRQYRSLCWFRGEAQEHVARGRELARLIAEAGVPTAMLKTAEPDQILYRDAHQIAAKPGPWTRVIA
ncbi:MAG: hypothetical protein HXY22_01850 [Alphaproteobacteria bacterium]|nr:hypothetical protein [Alphaproteobacteria bacterium]